jgi:hypothetical protein
VRQQNATILDKPRLEGGFQSITPCIEDRAITPSIKTPLKQDDDWFLFGEDNNPNAKEGNADVIDNVRYI